ncbi:hypothetical protein BDQ12DRAFT_666910 [Crucibulum laeve]|uniref:Uncharacterized protein n=1 Tax=Crucibulum laeve TaxID=68775 RepID=A0A5C3LY67_9AGAR|nr:hypothetical protein BDQ12DRAFT_666910 [Crucibulum laeve]
MWKEEEKLAKEEKAYKDKEIADLKEQVEHKKEIEYKKAEEEAAVHKKAQKDKEAQEHKEKEAWNAQCQFDEFARAQGRMMKAGGSQGSEGKEQKMGCKQRGTELAKLEVKCERCEKSGEKCMMPMKNAWICEACHNLQQAFIFPGNEDKPQRKHKAAKAVDSNNEAGLSKRSNTMTRGSDAGQDSWLIQETCKTQRELPMLISDAVFHRMVGLSKAMRWQKLPLACLRNGQMEFVSCKNFAEEGLGEELEETMRTMIEELKKVNRRLQKRAEKSGK